MGRLCGITVSLEDITTGVAGITVITIMETITMGENEQSPSLMQVEVDYRHREVQVAGGGELEFFLLCGM